MINQGSGYFENKPLAGSSPQDMKENKTKVLLYGIFNTISSLALGYFFYAFLDSFSVWNFIALCLFFVVSLALSVFNAIAIKDHLERFILVLLEVLAIIFFPAKLGGFWTIFAGISYLIFSISAQSIARSYSDNVIKFKFYNVAYHFSKSKSTAFAIFISLVLFGYGFYNGDKLGQGLVDSTINSSRFLLERYVPGINSSSSVDDILLGVVEKKAPVGTSVYAIQSSVSAFKKSLGETIGLNLTGKETILELVKDGTYEKTKNLPSLYKNIGWVILGLLVFWSIKSLTHLFSWAISIVAYIFYKIMLSSGFVRVNEEMITKESIII